MRRKEHRGTVKHCAKCDQWLLLSCFHRNKRNWDGLHAYCVSCMAAASRQRYARHRERLLDQAKAYRTANPDKRKDTLLRRKFGLSLDQFREIEQRQGGLCAICKRKSAKRLNVDHCHDSGIVRGLLCTPCNTALGAFNDDPERIRAAAAYVEACR